VSYDLEVHELFRAELSELGKRGVTPEMLADELGCKAHAVRSYGYDYSDVDPSAAGNGKTLRKVLRLVVAFAREGRPALLERVCGMAGYLAVPMPVGAGDELGDAAAAAETMRECGEGIAAFLRGGDTAGALAEIRQAQVRLAQLEVIVREREEKQG